MGGLWECYLQKEQGEKGRAKQGKKKQNAQDTEDGNPPPARSAGSVSHYVQWVRTGGCRGTSPGAPPLSSPLPTLSHPPFWRSPGQALLLRLCCMVRPFQAFKSEQPGLDRIPTPPLTSWVTLGRDGVRWVLISKSISSFVK